MARRSRTPSNPMMDMMDDHASLATVEDDEHHEDVKGVTLEGLARMMLRLDSRLADVQFRVQEVDSNVRRLSGQVAVAAAGNSQPQWAHQAHKPFGSSFRSVNRLPSVRDQTVRARTRRSEGTVQTATANQSPAGSELAESDDDDGFGTELKMLERGAPRKKRRTRDNDSESSDDRRRKQHAASGKTKLKSVLGRLTAIRAFQRLARNGVVDADTEVEAGLRDIEAIDRAPTVPDAPKERQGSNSSNGGPGAAAASVVAPLGPSAADSAAQAAAPVPPAERKRVSVVSPGSRILADDMDDEDGCDDDFECETAVLVMLPDSAFRITWDLLYMVFVGYEFVVWLFCLSTLGRGKGDVLIPVDGWFHVVRITLSLFWLADMYVQMTTATLCGWEIEEDATVLQKKYRKERLVFDMVVACPIDAVLAFALPPAWTYIAMTLRVLRLWRVPSLFQPSAPTRETPRWVECVQFSFWFVILSHVCACIWIAAASEDEQKIDGGLGSSPYDVYTQGLYFVTTTMTSVGYGDVSPSDNGTRWYAMWLQLVGVALMMLVSGRTGAYFITTDPFKLMQIERRRRLESLMVHEAIPWNVQKEAFTIYPSLLEAGMRDYQSILLELPEFIREKITRHIKVSLIGNVPMFKGVSRRVLTHVAEVLREDYRGSKEYLIQAGETGHEMYILSQGMVEVLIPDRTRSGYEVWAANLKAGSWFGEIALLKQTTRTASVRSVTSCVLYKLDKHDFDAVLSRSEELRRRLHEETERRMVATREKERTAAGRVGAVVGSLAIDREKANAGTKVMGLKKVINILSNLSVRPSFSPRSEQSGSPHAPAPPPVSPNAAPAEPSAPGQVPSPLDPPSAAAKLRALLGVKKLDDRSEDSRSEPVTAFAPKPESALGTTTTTTTTEVAEISAVDRAATLESGSGRLATPSHLPSAAGDTQ
eukprot:TRINITY_DN4111_c0_g1_i3.p1 TRINITY_DN4111_c0_g1~~TRINITY_DN4111_c0_g1_i3.p1  ORF type:complete len:934 (+),score=343.87 TRINITY_DN4111_c0_g1_i3:84-2885(+)